MPRILLVTTGGTIASGIEAGGLATGTNLLAHYAQDPDLSCDVLEAMRLPSSQIGPKEMLDLSARVAAGATEDAYAGIVITHGTDTLEETAVFLDLLHDGDKPVVLTGAMRGAAEPGPDGAANLAAAIVVALDESSIGRGVLVVLNEHIHSARYVSKTHSKSVAAFESPETGPIGFTYRGLTRYIGSPHPRTTVPRPQGDLVTVALLRVSAGDDGSLVRSAAVAGFGGLVVEAMGVGNLPAGAAQAILEARALGMPVVLTTRCGAGPVVVPRVLAEAGVVPAGHGYTGPKARIALMLALSGGLVESELPRIWT